jgi:hypothetical protein
MTLALRLTLIFHSMTSAASTLILMILHAFTHSVVWASVIASACVAVITTLLVEYLAKPGLEVRKDRILEKHRNNRSALDDLSRIIFLAEGMVNFQRMSEDRPWYERMIKFAEEIEPLAFELSKTRVLENLRVPETIRKDWVGAMSSIIITSIGMRDKELSGHLWGRFNIAHDKLERYYILLTTARWKYRKRHKFIHEIESSRSIDIS